MKITIKRYGTNRHGFDRCKVVCPDCGAKWSVIIEQNVEYANNKYIINYECESCKCLFEVKSENLKQFD